MASFQVVLILALLEMFCSAESSTKKTLPMDLLDATLTDDELVAVLGNDVDMEREVDVSLPSSLAVLALDKNVSLMLTDANYLHIASAAGRDKFVTHLLQHGGDVKTGCSMAHGLDYNEIKPLHLAALFGHTTTAEILIGAGAAVDTRADPGNVNPLHMAADRGNVALAKLLLAKGASVDGVGNRKHTSPLHLAVHHGHTELVRLLLEHGASVDLQSHYGDGDSALLSAAMNGHLDIVELLLDAGANANLKASDGKTALTLATERGHTHVAERLRRHIAAHASKEDL